MRFTSTLLMTALLIGAGVQTGFGQEPQATTPPAEAAPVEEEQRLPGMGSDTFIQVQRDTIHLTFVDFHERADIKTVQEQMYSIPGLTNFIPYMATKGLITYDVRYSGSARLLVKALRDTMGRKYEIGMKEMGKRQWEITMRKL